MAITRKANRKYPSLPIVSGDPASHSEILTAMKAAMEIGQRRTSDFLSSFVQIRDLVDIGLIDSDGNASSDFGSGGGGSSDFGDIGVNTVLGRNGPGDGEVEQLTMDELRAMLGLGQGSEVRGASFVGFNAPIRIPVGKVNLTIKEDCTITKCVVLTQGGPGDCQIDIQKIPYESFPPTSLESIVGATPPLIDDDIKYQDESLSDWTTALSEGDTLQFELVSTDIFTAVFVFLILQPVDSTPADGYTDDRVREIVQEELTNFSVVINGSTYTVNLFAGDFADVILWDLIGQPSGAVTVNFNVSAGSHFRATSTAGFALDFRGFTTGSVINWNNLSFTHGKGGRGGRGASAGNTFGEDGGSGRRGISGHGASDGENGGSAVAGPDTGVTLNITNANGYIFGGGGGGGGGGATLNFAADTDVAAGGAGGGGAGGGDAGEPGTAICSNTTTPTQVKATRGTSGGSSRTSTGGTAGAGAESGGGEGGDGGAGGDYGSAGSAGGSPTAANRDYSGGSAGSAGKAIDLTAGGTVNFVSGNDATHVKGAVS